jgi:hypothetical protein
MSAARTLSGLRDLDDEDGHGAMSAAQSRGPVVAFQPQRPAAARQNNFDALRLIVAASVVFSKSSTCKRLKIGDGH